MEGEHGGLQQRFPSFEHLLEYGSGGGKTNQVLWDLVQRAEGIPVIQLWEQILAPGCSCIVRILGLFPLASCRKRSRGGEVKAPPAQLSVVSTAGHVEGKVLRQSSSFVQAGAPCPSTRLDVEFTRDTTES